MAFTLRHSLIAEAILIICIVYTGGTLAQNGYHYQNCGVHSIFAVDSFTVSTNTPQVGKPITLTAQVDSAETVTGGKVDLQVTGRDKLSFIKINKELDLCKVSPHGCPIAKGKTSLTVTRDVPPFVPAGTYDVVVRAKDDKQRELICASIEITFKK